MPIQIPKITANQTQAAQGPRVQEQPLNVQGPMQQTQTALDSAGKEIVRYRDQIAYQEADNIATDADNQYQDWHKKELYGDPTTGKVGLLYQQGDPKTNFNDFNERAKKKLDELSSASEDQNWSDLTQTVVNRRLNKRDEELKMEELTAYGHQKYKYDTDTADTAVDYAQKRMPFSSTNVDPSRPETFGALQQNIEDVKQPIISHALKYGGAVQTEDGSVILTPAVKAQVAKAVSDGLYQTIDNLYTTGGKDALAKAEAIKEQFGDQLDPFHKDKLGDSAKKAGIEDRANELSKDLAGKSPEQIKSALKDEDPLVARKAAEYIDANGRYFENMTERKQKENYRAAYKQALDFVQNNPDATQSDVQHQAWYKSLSKNMSPTQTKAILSTVEPPATSNTAALTRVQNILQGTDEEFPDPSQMSPEDRAKVLSQIGKDPEGKFVRQRLLEAAMPTNSQKTGQYGKAMSELKNQAINMRLVTDLNDGGTDIAKGSSDAQRLNDLYIQFGKQIKPLLGEMNPEDIKEQAHDFIANEIKKQQSSPGLFGRFFGGSQPQETAAPAKGPPPPTAKQVNGAAIKEWSSTHGSPPTGQELKSYILSKPANYKWKIQ